MLPSHICESDSAKSTEDSDAQVQGEEQAVCASPDSESTSELI